MTTKTTSRRTVLRSTAWAVPVITVAGAAPAFATSPELKPKCKPIGYKFPGKSHDGKKKKKKKKGKDLGIDKGYILTSLGCVYSSAVSAVHIDGRLATWRTDLKTQGWFIGDQGDSRAKLWVKVVFKDNKTWEGEVHFDPWQQNK